MISSIHIVAKPRNVSWKNSPRGDKHLRLELAANDVHYVDSLRSHDVTPVQNMQVCVGFDLLRISDREPAPIQMIARMRAHRGAARSFSYSSPSSPDPPQVPNSPRAPKLLIFRCRRFSSARTAERNPTARTSRQAPRARPQAVPQLAHARDGWHALGLPRVPGRAHDEWRDRHAPKGRAGSRRGSSLAGA